VPTFSRELHETYVRLLCQVRACARAGAGLRPTTASPVQFEPRGVYNHVVTHIAKLDLKKVQALCEEYKINDATAYVLGERAVAAGGVCGCQ
jgi:hypothetical protein